MPGPDWAVLAGATVLLLQALRELLRLVYPPPPPPEAGGLLMDLGPVFASRTGWLGLGWLGFDVAATLSLLAFLVVQYWQTSAPGRSGTLFDECDHAPRCWESKPFMTGVLLRALKMHHQATCFMPTPMHDLARLGTSDFPAVEP